MRVFRRLAALVLALSLLALPGCGGEAEPSTLTVCVGEKMETLDPIYAVSETDRTILTHLYENLMRLTVDMEGNTVVDTGLAKSVDQEENHDGTVTFTFRLRSARWSDGEDVTAEDFVYAWQRLANPVTRSPNAELLSMVAGYDEARESGDMTLLQVTAKNSSTLEVVLSGTCEWFLNEVCTSPATAPLREDVVQSMKEEELASVGEGEEARPWWSSVKRLVTSGPYTVANRTEDSLELTASQEYTGTMGDVERLIFRYADTPEAGAELFENEEVDFLWPVPAGQMAELPEAAQARVSATTCVLYNSGADVFADPQVRKALSLVIDREAVTALAGISAETAYALVPEGAPGDGEESFRQAGGDILAADEAETAENLAMAQALLMAAGYDDGTDMEALQMLYVDEGTNAAVAQALAAQWFDALRIRVEPVPVIRESLEEALATGSYTMAIAEVDSCSSDAEGYLMHWVTGAAGNTIGYSNSAYDTLLAIIATASDSTARFGCLHDAELLLLKDGALSPLYTTGTGWRLRDTLQHVGRDDRGWFTFSFVSERTQ